MLLCAPIAVTHHRLHSPNPLTVAPQSSLYPHLPIGDRAPFQVVGPVPNVEISN